MTIKTIRPGKLPPERSYRGTCYHCGCEVTCKRKDGQYADDQRDGESVMVRCPTVGCDAQICCMGVK